MDESHGPQKSRGNLGPCKRRGCPTKSKRKGHRLCRFSASESDEEWGETLQPKANTCLKPSVGRAYSSLSSSGIRQETALCEFESLSSSSAEEESRYAQTQMHPRQRKRQPTAFLDAAVLIAPSFRRKRGDTDKTIPHSGRRRLLPVSDGDSSQSENENPLRRRPRPASKVGVDADSCLKQRRRLRPVSDSESSENLRCDGADMLPLHPRAESPEGGNADTSGTSAAWKPCAQGPETPSSGSDWDLCWPERQALGLCSAPSTPGAGDVQHQEPEPCSPAPAGCHPAGNTHENLTEQHAHREGAGLPPGTVPAVALDAPHSGRPQDVEDTLQTPSQVRVRGQDSVLPDSSAYSAVLSALPAVLYLSFS